MPTYSYSCCKCNQDFELFFYIKDYIENPKCIHCGNKKTNRSLAKDVMTLNSSIVKSDGELKTIGDLANRNRDRFSDDQKQGLFDKHNSYKEHKEEKPLPKGMSRIKKKGKVKWTQS